MNADELFSTEQAAQQLGTNRDNLLVWINRHPEYRPRLQIGGGSLIWTAPEIERAKAGRAETRKLAGRQSRRGKG